jgi:hypothetical protein
MNPEQIEQLAKHLAGEDDHPWSLLLEETREFWRRMARKCERQIRYNIEYGAKEPTLAPEDFK